MDAAKAKWKRLKAKLAALEAVPGTPAAKLDKLRARVDKAKGKYKAAKHADGGNGNKKRKRGVAGTGEGTDGAAAAAAPSKRARSDDGAAPAAATATAVDGDAEAGAGAGSGTGDDAVRIVTPADGGLGRRRGGVTRLFVGNLPFKVTAEKLRSFLQGNATHIMWLTDKETGRFYGSAFVEMSSAGALQSALALNGNKLMGRPIKMNAAPPRPQDEWPPADAEITAGKGPRQEEEEVEFVPGSKPTRSPKPFDDCVKVFLGNLSYDIEEEAVRTFFAECGTISQIRWLTSRETGEFRGQAYAEFSSAAAADKAVLQNGNKVAGRAIVIDWAE